MGTFYKASLFLEGGGRLWNGDVRHGVGAGLRNIASTAGLLKKLIIFLVCQLLGAASTAL
jgi:NADH:ubiquinone oxidoreductase subunit 5 (subunit L)/multisubunit Na+/H+ antiporter MnhA subunit